MNKFSVRTNGLEVELTATGLPAAIPEAIKVIENLNGFNTPEYSTILMPANDEVSNSQLEENKITSFRLVAMRSDHPIAAKLKLPADDKVHDLRQEIEDELANNITMAAVPFFFKWDVVAD